MKKKICLLLLCLLTIETWGQLRDDKVKYTIYLMGDAGKASPQDPQLIKMFEEIKQEDEKTAVIYLGDNIYPEGLSDPNSLTRKHEEDILKAQLSPLKDFKGRVWMIPGNHDYAKGKKYGWENLKRQEAFVNQLLGDSTFAPYNSCPDPVEVNLTDDLVLIILDTQWWLYEFNDHAIYQDCDIRTPEEYMIQLQDILFRNKNKQVIVAAHHPMYTYGRHGGHFTFKNHLFPLTDIKSWLYIPLPVIGSIYPLARKSGVSPQDIHHAKYRKMRDVFETLFKEHPGLIYAAGHEHTLQYIEKDSVHYIVSGSGSKISPVQKRKYAQWAVSEKGYAKVTYFESGKVDIQYFNHLEEIYNTSYQSPEVKRRMKQYDISHFPDSILVQASTQYVADKKKVKWLGENYRKEWEAPVKVPVFNLDREKGGLKIIKKGGGMATLSFRLQDSLGNQYTLRSIDKNPYKAIPSILRGTIAEDIVQDQISAAHPYSALSVPRMADAIDVYHANPKVVYVMDDPRFGIYQELAANQMFMFEERPSKNTGEIESFGYAKKIYSTFKVVEKLQEDNDHEIDYRFTVRSRLFDMLVGDWDRHDDQWRWAVFEKKKGKMFRPIPRDRDQVFFVNQGLFPKLASRRWIMPKFEGFDEKIRWEPGFNFNARYFDRYFLTQASRQDWLEEAQFIQQQMSDEVIEQAIRDLPDSVSKISGDEIVRILKVRRSQLVSIAEKYYLSLSKFVSIVGTNKKELYQINRLENGKTHVKGFKVSKKGNVKQLIYDRVFSPSETKEIRIYGLGGDDQYVMEGEKKSKIKIRVVGGSGTDQYLDETTSKTSKNILLYDTKDSTEIVQKGGAIKKKLANREDVNKFERVDFKYNTFLPLLYGGFLPDDGIMIGGGFIHTVHQFRKYPFGMRHQLLGAVSVTTGAFKMKYKGIFTDLLGTADLKLNAELRSPKNSNFYGIGNSTPHAPDRDDDYYRFFYTYHQGSAALGFNLSRKVTFDIGANFIFTNVTRRSRYLDGRFFLESGADQTLEEPYGDQQYMGLLANFQWDARDNQVIPKKGAYFNFMGNFLKNLYHKELNYLNLKGELALYKTIQVPRDFTLVAHMGGAYNIGDYHYLMSNKLGGRLDLRGFRRDRFYGRTSFYSNLEGRLDIYKFRNSIIPFTFGILGFYDFGRVWADQENSTQWHQGGGGGIYLIPIDVVAVSLTAAASRENVYVYVNFGFRF